MEMISGQGYISAHITPVIDEAAMVKKVLIDCDPGIDDSVALCLALFDPRLEVVAITATAGNVDAYQSTSNVVAILDQLDPPKRPRLGNAAIKDQVARADARHIHGEDGLGDVGIVGTEMHNPHPAEKVISDVLREYPGEVTIIALGPLTNLARALQMEQDLAPLIDRVIMMGGSVEGIGNITPAAEFNMYCDPEAARFVFQSPTTKTLIPLDVTSRVTLDLDFVSQLPAPSTRAGSLMHQLVPALFRAYHRELGEEGIHLHDAVAMLYAVHPELFEMREMAGDVEVSGELTRGATIFDRRARASWRNNMEVAYAVDEVELEECIVRGLRYAGQLT